MIEFWNLALATVVMFFIRLMMLMEMPIGITLKSYADFN